MWEGMPINLTVYRIFPSSFYLLLNLGTVQVLLYIGLFPSSFISTALGTVSATLSRLLNDTAELWSSFANISKVLIYMYLKNLSCYSYFCDMKIYS